jgi:hypothetical protein
MRAFVLLFLGVLSFSVSGQKIPSWLSIGLKGGVNIQNYATDFSFKGESVLIRNNSSFKQGYTIGGYARVGKKFFVQPEMTLSTRGGKMSALNSLSGLYSEVDSDYMTIDAPLLVGYTFNKYLYVVGGPVVSLGHARFDNLEELTHYYFNGYGKLGIPRFMYSYQAGVGFTYSRVSLDVRYELGQTDLAADLLKPEGVYFSQKPQSLHVTVGFKLF